MGDGETGEGYATEKLGTATDYPGDKAIFKAETGATKYFLSALLSIPMGDGSDPETTDHGGGGAKVDRKSTKPASDKQKALFKDLMGKANLFEFVEDQEPDETIEKLNELVKFYAGGTISKLRPSSDNTVDFRVKPINGDESFTFDGLSSGQKEIISTLFLIWYHTKNNPSVVFIDEPELHLNAQWHRSFVKNLVSLAPQNQYIMATHSEDVMDSVGEDRRVLLLNNQEGDK